LPHEHDVDGGTERGGQAGDVTEALASEHEREPDRQGAGEALDVELAGVGIARDHVQARQPHGIERDALRPREALPGDERSREVVVAGFIGAEARRRVRKDRVGVPRRNQAQPEQGRRSGGRGWRRI
jgi:hypothetical protein